MKAKFTLASAVIYIFEKQTISDFALNHILTQDTNIQ